MPQVIFPGTPFGHGFGKLNCDIKSKKTLPPDVMLTINFGVNIHIEHLDLKINLFSWRAINHSVYFVFGI